MGSDTRGRNRHPRRQRWHQRSAIYNPGGKARRRGCRAAVTGGYLPGGACLAGGLTRCCTSAGPARCAAGSPRTDCPSCAGPPAIGGPAGPRPRPGPHGHRKAATSLNSTAGHPAETLKQSGRQHQPSKLKHVHHVQSGRRPMCLGNADLCRPSAPRAALRGQILLPARCLEDRKPTCTFWWVRSSRLALTWGDASSLSAWPRVRRAVPTVFWVG